MQEVGQDLGMPLALRDGDVDDSLGRQPTDTAGEVRAVPLVNRPGLGVLGQRARLAR